MQEAFYPLEFSLTPVSKEELAHVIEPIFRRNRRPGHLEKHELQRLAYAIAATFPAEALDAMQDMANHAQKHPIIIHNLPETQVDPTRSDKKDNGEAFFSYYISQGLYYLLNAQADPSQVLKRKPFRKPTSVPPGGDIHSDPWVLSALACPWNTEQAPTRFFDWRNVIASVEKEGLTQHIQGDYGENIVSLSHYAALPGKRIGNSAINIITDDTPEYSRFQELLHTSKADIVLQPGDLAVWDNRAIFHQARNGNLEKIPQQEYSRIAVFTGADV